MLAVLWRAGVGVRDTGKSDALHWRPQRKTQDLAPQNARPGTAKRKT